MLKKHMKILQIVLCGWVVSALVPVMAMAADKVSVQDRLIGQTFKTLAKAYVTTADMSQIKEKCALRLERMRETRFEKKYAEVYKVIGALPPAVRSRYGLKEQMTKAQALQIVHKADKKMLYEMITNVPDPVIASEFRERMGGEEPGQDQDGLLKKIAKAWEAIVAKVNKSAGPSQ